MTFDASFWTCMGFITLIGGIGRPAWRGLVRTLDERSAQIKKDIEEATRLRVEAQAFLNLCKHQQLEVHTQVKEIIQHAHDEADRLRVQALADIQEHTQIEERLLKERMHMLETQALEEIRCKAIQLAGEIAEKNINEIVTPDYQKKMIDKVFDSIKIA